MVINPDQDWDDNWLKRIQVEEERIACEKKVSGHYDICGTPTARGTPCTRPPLIHHGVNLGRCRKHATIPEMPVTKAGILGKKVSMMRCNVCDLQHGHCQEFEVGAECPIESALYDELWAQLNEIYQQRTLKTELLCDMLVWDCIRKDRCIRYEHYLSTSVYITDKIMDAEEKITNRILKVLKELEVITKSSPTERQSILQRLKVDNK